jgi:predicted RNA binding protein YcfA (HicA-like mRNA interferase family)
MNREIRKIVKKYEKRGWYLDRIGKHYVYKHKEGGCVTVSSTASDQNAFKSIERDFISESKKNEHSEA